MGTQGEKGIELANVQSDFGDDFIGAEESPIRPNSAMTASPEIEKDAKVTKEEIDKKPKDSDKPKDKEKEKEVPKIVPPPKKTKQAISSLNKYAQYDKYHPLNQPFPAIENFKGPKFERKPTDLIGIIFPFIFGAVFVFHLVLTHLNGWPTLLTKPLDFRAKLCGIGSLKHRPFLYFLTPSIDLNVAMCVEECPTTTGKPINVYEKDGTTLTPFTYTRIQCDRIGKFCYPVEPTPRQKVENFLTTPIRYVKRIIGELFLTFDVVALGLVIINAMSFGVLFGLRKKVTIKAVVWGSITLTVICLEVFGFFCYKKYLSIIAVRCLFGENRHGCGGISSMVYLILAFVFWAVGFLYLGLMAFYFNHINLVIGIMGAALKVTMKTSEIKSAPVVSGVLISGVCLAILWLIVEAGSIGQVRKIEAKNIDGKKVKIFQFNDFHLNFVPIDMLLAYYIMLFLLALIESITSYAVAIWFFSKKKDTTKLDLHRCYKDTTKFHLGTIGLLTLVKFIFKPIRLFTRPLYSSLASANQKNFVIRFLQVVCIPCIWLDHKVIRFLSKSVFVQMNIWSTKYTIASKQSYYLVKIRHGDRGVGNEELIEFVLRQLKISISLFSSLVFYMYVNWIPYSPSFKSINDVADPLIGSIFVFAYGLFVSSAYTGAYDIIIRTIVHCNFIDEEMFVGEQKFTEPFLNELMNYWKKNDDDDKMNANAQQVKKKDIQKDALNFDEHYKKVPEGEEDDFNIGPDSDEDEGPQDMFTEKKKRPANRDQDFDEEFLKPKEPAKPNKENAKELAKKPAEDDGMNAAVEFEGDDEEMGALNKANKNKDLNDLMMGQSAVSVEMTQQKPIVFEGADDQLEKKSPRPILKNSKAADFDDNRSMKSSISKKVKVKDEKQAEEKKPEVIFLAPEESGLIPKKKTQKDEDDDNKSSKSKRLKLDVKKIADSKPLELPTFTGENTDKLATGGKKKDEDNLDNVSAKLSKKSKKTKPSEPEPPVTHSLLSPEYKAKADMDDDLKSSKSKISLSKKNKNKDSQPADPITTGDVKKLGESKPPLQLKKPEPFVAPNQDDDKISAKMSVRSKSKNNARDMSARKMPATQPESGPNKPFDDKSKSVLERLMAAKQAPPAKNDDFEDDFMKEMESVVDKKGSDIRILNASQGASMLSKKSKKGPNNASEIKFNIRDQSDDDENYF